MKSKKIEIIMSHHEDYPETYYFIPSGYLGMVIQVFESAHEELYVELITKEEMEKMTNLKFSEREEKSAEWCPNCGKEFDSCRNCEAIFRTIKSPDTLEE